MKKFVKLCLHLAFIVQNSFHFDEIFHIKFKIPILQKSLKNSSNFVYIFSYIVQNSFHFDEIFHIKFKLPILFCMLLIWHLVAILSTIETKIDLPL